MKDTHRVADIRALDQCLAYKHATLMLADIAARDELVKIRHELCMYAHVRRKHSTQEQLAHCLPGARPVE